MPQTAMQYFFLFLIFYLRSTYLKQWLWKHSFESQCFKNWVTQDDSGTLFYFQKRAFFSFRAIFTYKKKASVPYRQTFRLLLCHLRHKKSGLGILNLCPYLAQEVWRRHYKYKVSFYSSVMFVFPKGHSSRTLTIK